MKQIARSTRGVVSSLANSNILKNIVMGLAIETLDRLRIASQVYKVMMDHIRLLRTLGNDELRIRRLTDLLR